MNVSDFALATASEITSAYRQGRLCPVEFTTHLLAEIKAKPEANTFVALTEARALAEAEAARARYVAGLPLSCLDGVPVGWKDNIDVAGAPTRAGSRVLSCESRTADADCVANAARAGVISIGKLNMTELAYSGLGLNPHFGTPANYRAKRAGLAPGGSSSGTGVAVGAGFVPIAVGTDTGGSVRIPAAFNGVFGYKSSTGLIPTQGLLPLSSTLDTIGVIARSVEDCRTMGLALAGTLREETPEHTLDEPMRYVVPEDLDLSDGDLEVLNAFRDAITRLKSHGAVIHRRPIPAFSQMLAFQLRHGTITAAEAYVEFRHLVDGEPAAQMDPRVLMRIFGGKQMKAHDLIILQRARRRLMAELKAQLDGFMLLTPTTLTLPPEVSAVEADRELFFRFNEKALRLTSVGNTLGMCGVAIPTGHTNDGHPTSLLISAPDGRDAGLFAQSDLVAKILAESLV